MFGIEVLKNTRDFEDIIKAQNKTLTIDKTCSNFKTHFEADRSVLKYLQWNTIQRTAFQQANYMADQVIQEVKILQELVSRVLESIPPNQADQEYIPPLELLVDTVTNETIHANDNVQLQILELIKHPQE